MGNSAGKNAVLYPNGGHQYPLDVPLVDKGLQKHLWVSPPSIDPTSWDWFITSISFHVSPFFANEATTVIAYGGVCAPIMFNFVKYNRLLHFLNLKAGSNISDSLKEFMPTGGFDGTISNSTIENDRPKHSNSTYNKIFTWTADPQYALSGIQCKYTNLVSKSIFISKKATLMSHITFYSSPVIPDASLPIKSQEFFFTEGQTGFDKNNPIVTTPSNIGISHSTTDSGKFIREIGLGAIEVRCDIGTSYMASHWKDTYEPAFIGWNSVGDMITKSLTKIPKSIDGDRYAIEDFAKLFYKSDNSGVVDKGVDGALVPQKPYLYDYYNWMLKVWVASWGDPMVNHGDDDVPLPELTYCMSTKWAPITNPIGLMHYIKEEVMSRDPSSQLFIQSQSTCWSAVCNGDKRLGERTHLLTTDLIDVECPLPDKVTVCSVTNNIFDSTDIDLKGQKVNQYCGNDPGTDDPPPGGGGGDGGNIIDDALAYIKPFTDWVMESPLNMTIVGMGVVGILILLSTLFSSAPSFDDYDDDDNLSNNNNNNNDDDEYYYRYRQLLKKEKKRKAEEKKRVISNKKSSKKKKKKVENK